MIDNIEIQIMTADVMTIPLESFDGFDTLIVDPPYSPYVHENMASHGVHGRGSRARDPGFGALTPPLRERISQIAGRMRRWSVVFCDLESTHLWRYDVERWGEPHQEYVRETRLLERDPEVAFDVPWVRWSQPQLSGDRPPQGAEAVLHFHRAGKKRTNCRGNLVAYESRALRAGGEAPKHPTEKPLDLLLDLVSWWSDPGENVLDVCAGAGTTALACKLLGRSCLAIEIDPQWHERALARAGLQWLDRDRARALEWCARTEAEASEHLRKPALASGEDENTRRRAEARIADVSRVREWL